MAEFIYEAVDSSGRKVRGRLEAGTRDIAVQELRKKGLAPVLLTESKPPAVRYAPGLGGISVGHLAVLTRKFASLTKTDIPIVEILEILADEEESLFVKRALEDVARRVATGTPIGDAMAANPRVFSKLYIRMVEAGLNSGTLDLVADNLARLYENENELRKQLWSKLTYPFILLGFCFFAGFVLLIAGFIKPSTFAVLLSFWMILAGLAVLGMTRPGYRVYREIGFRLPAVGTLMRNINLARFCRIFGLQYAAGVPVLEGLDVAKEVLQDSELERAIVRLKALINDGFDLRDAMLQVGVFPRRVVGMVGVGERGGGVDQMLEKLAEYYELDISTQSTVMATVLYFVVFLAVAVSVAIVVISGWSHYFGMISSLLGN